LNKKSPHKKDWLRIITLSILLFFSSCEAEKMQHTNALIHESSPYLLQHAHNPVDWHPWSEAVIEKAQRENKLILVSIGYSACHWCHVMERETFEDQTAAALMNEHFICIKVDREERPDLDQVYMSAVQLMSGQGGWPLNCFTLPDGRPIYGGTYFKRDQWMEVLRSLSELYANDRAKVEEYANRLTEGVQMSELIVRDPEASDLSPENLAALVERWKSQWDLNEGGPNRAPKFPLPNNFRFLLQYAALVNDAASMEHVELTLDKMAQGGIYDQLGGGFARYSTDAMWKVPHFEKMLYDNAQLVSLYCEGYRKFKKSDYKWIVEQTLVFVEREMKSTEGLFFSALDADSEGEEGKFYVWKKAELENLLGDRYDMFAKQFEIDGMAHWEFGNNILLRRNSFETFAKQNNLEATQWFEEIKADFETLMHARKSRIRPGTDDKILTSWNAMMIEGYTDAYRTFNNSDYLNTAITAMEQLLSKCSGPDGRLFHTYKNETAKVNGYLEDYAFTIQALIALYQATFNERWLEEAQQLNAYATEHFYDDQTGMYWFTSDLDPALIARKQENSDNVIPASNSTMAKNLFILGHYYADAAMIETAKQMLVNVAAHWDYLPSYTNWASLHLWFTYPMREVAITGSESLVFAREIDSHYIPNIMLLGGNGGKLPLLEGKQGAQTTIFVCENKTCQRPVTTPEDAIHQLTH
jgi:uncharacterized protein